MPDSRIGRIHHPILEAGILVLLARCARSHRCRRRKARWRLKREPLNEKWKPNKSVQRHRPEARDEELLLEPHVNARMLDRAILFN